MGKLFLTLLLVGSAILCPRRLLSQDRIELMPAPRPVLPPNLNADELYQDDLERKRSQRARREADMRPQVSPSIRRDKALAAESDKPRPYVFMSQVSLVYPFIATSGARHDYTVDLTSHFTAMFRLKKGPPTQKPYLWAGLRLAPFAGTGVYEKTPGRYGFTYFGPSFGIGKINPAEGEADKDEPAENADAKPPSLVFKHRSGWFLLGGLALHSRAAATEASNDPVDRDFNTVRGGKLDGSGLWLEFIYTTIHFGAVGTHYVSGVQLGEGKVFVWAGVAAGAWY